MSLEDYSQHTMRLSIIIAVSVLLGFASVAGAEQKKIKLAYKETIIGKLVPGARADQIQFSADGRHAAYLVKKASRLAVVMDGKESEEYDWILASTLVLSDAGGHCAFVAQLKDGMQLIVDGKPQKLYAEV